MYRLGEKLIILSAHDALQRVHDLAYPYEQESNFLYLTGIREAGWKLIIDGYEKKSWLIAPEVADVHRLFDGALDHEQAKRSSGVDEVLDAEQGQALLKRLASTFDTVYSLAEHPHEDYFSFTVNPAQARLWAELEVLFTSVKDCRSELAAIRAIKTDEELLKMKQVISLSIDGFEAVRQKLQNVHHEYEVEAILTYSFRNAGAMGHAYDPIVAGGSNACTLHYVHNNAPLPMDGLVLIDAGARVDGYCADITRTYAIGTPTERQKAVHAAVEKAHHQIIALLGPGVSVTTYHEQVDAIMKAALESLNLLNTPEDYRRYFPHAISHGLGIDVHDALGAPTHFKPGMVLTVEPGIYIPEEGIGVRIEDDILITESGVENLSGDLPTSL